VSGWLINSKMSRFLLPAMSWGQTRIADTGLILAARRAGSQLAASTAARSTAVVETSVSGS
jgi:hypothetical protein